VLSASAFDHERIEALEVGGDAFLSKPFREEAVFGQLENLLGIRFVREQADAVRMPGDGSVLKPERLSSLPAALRSRLTAAAAGGESDVLQTLSEEAAAHDAAVGAELAALARAYRFDEIEAALAACGARKAASS
jgi:DNA-binding response OmpR family regulator